MDSQLENKYSQNMDLALQLTINSGFLVLKDFSRLASVDKFLSYIYKKRIGKYYDILQKCSLKPFSTHINDIFLDQYNERLFNRENIYMFDNNWNNLFCKQLNNDEMAIYYTYFIFRFHKFYITDNSSKYWRCVLYENGFVKSFSETNNYYNGIKNVDDTDIILKIIIYYKYRIYRNYPKKLLYWGTKITFENKGKVINPEFVNLKLLNKLIISNPYMNMVSKKFL